MIRSSALGPIRPGDVAYASMFARNWNLAVIKPNDRKREREPSAFSEQKIASIVVAARALFTKHGYGATSMDSVAAEAGVGKATVYAHFKSKTELFAAVIVSEADFRVAPVRSADDEHIGTALGRYAHDMFSLIMRPTTTALFRVIAAEAARFPDLGRVFYDSGPVEIQADLAATLRHAMDLGELRRQQPHIVACQFLALICGDLQMRELVGVGSSINAAERHVVLSSGLDAFLRAYCLKDVDATIEKARTALAASGKRSRTRSRRKTEPASSVFT